MPRFARGNGSPTPALRWRPVAGFAAYGFSWGAWGASVPEIRARAGATEAELGVALVVLGAAALPAMWIAGRLVDRYGPTVAAALLVAHAGTWVAVSWSASPAALVVTLGLVGATSGAADVAINAVAAGAERLGVRACVPLGHAFFSLSVLVASAATGLARDGGLEPRSIMPAVLVLAVGAAFVTIGVPRPPADDSGQRRRGRPSTALLALGAVCALGYFSENAHQTWGSSLLEDERSAAPAIAALAPASFAAATAAARLVLQALGVRRAGITVLVGATVAAAGTLMVAAPAPLAITLVGFAVAGAGTGVVAPSLISAAGAVAEPGRQGSAVSTVAGIGYVGFLASPAAVGGVADAASIGAAFVMCAGVLLVAALGAAALGRVVPSQPASTGAVSSPVGSSPSPSSS